MIPKQSSARDEFDNPETIDYNRLNRESDFRSPLLGFGSLTAASFRISLYAGMLLDSSRRIAPLVVRAGR
jgi:hypothetical protein